MTGVMTTEQPIETLFAEWVNGVDESIPPPVVELQRAAFFAGVLAALSKMPSEHPDAERFRVQACTEFSQKFLDR